MNNDAFILPDNMKALLEIVKSRADDEPEEKLLGLLVGSCFDSDGEICNDLIDHMTEYISSNPTADIDDIYEHLIYILPGAEFVQDEESA